MVNYPLLISVALIAACGTAGAGTLTISTSGQFSGSDTPGTLVVPNALFNLSFDLDTPTTPLTGTVTSLGFDVAVTNFVYDLAGAPVLVSPDEIRFNTLANGGGFDITFGSGLTAQEFDFQGDQLFTGTTAAPVFGVGSFPVSSWMYSDPVNFDMGTAVPEPISVATAAGAVPEPSTYVLISAGLLTLGAIRLRKMA
jgi:hypothetical protein